MMPALAEVGVLAAGAGALIAGTAKAIVWVIQVRRPEGNGNGKAAIAAAAAAAAADREAAKMEGWQKGVLDRQIDLLEILVKGQGAEREMLRESMGLTRDMARELKAHGEHETVMWKQIADIQERVLERLDALVNGRATPRRGG